MKIKSKFKSFTILEILISLLFVSISITYIMSFLFTILSYFLFIQKKAILLFTQKNFVSCCFFYNNNHNKEIICLAIITNNHNNCHGYKISSKLLDNHKHLNTFKLTCYNQEKIIDLIA